MAEQDVVGIGAVDGTQVALVGGKGAALGELARIEGVTVPDGFCVTTDAFRRAGGADVPDAPLPEDLAAAITAAVRQLGEHGAYAVRSSATAEDAPGASFAGQHDSSLDVVGPAAVVEHVRRCWASLATDRAVAYRRHHRLDDDVAMAVVVQRMVPAEAAGVLFTADPVTSHRKVAAVEAVVGLGDALVSGRRTPDAYRVRAGEVVTRAVAGASPVLTDEQVLRLVALGRRIEAHLGCPQDIEWCLVDDGFQIVQSRPVTTLFPVPERADDEPHVYVSVGHGQMMTDAMRPLGLSMWQLTAATPMHEAGSRLFVDVTRALSSPAGRAGLLATMDRGDPLVGDALRTIVERGDVVPAPPAAEAPAAAPAAPSSPPTAPPSVPAVETDPGLVPELIAATEASVAALEQALATVDGPELFDLVRADIEATKRLLLAPPGHPVLMAGIEAVWWLDDHIEEWLGERNGAGVLIRSVPHDVTAEMGLALLDVADAVRPHPDVVALLRRVDGPRFLDDLDRVAGGPEARRAIEAWLDRYGQRGVGEIDITRPRWRERPDRLVPIVLGHVDHVVPGERARRIERGRQEAERAARELLARLRARPDGERKAAETERMIDRARTFIGYREYPKFGLVSRSFLYKQALLAEVDRLVRAGVLARAEDAFFLTFDELGEAVRTHRLDDGLVPRRRAAFRAHQALAPPRVLTSEGEVVAGSYHRDDRPPGALVGLGVSAGTVEGRARVVLDLAAADLAPGDILVTPATDPSWTPLFVGIAGLVTEVGGSMTHGAVVAREYGLPTVVGVEDATRLVADGQRIRLDGAAGWVELLP